MTQVEVAQTTRPPAVAPDDPVTEEHEGALFKVHDTFREQDGFSVRPIGPDSISLGEAQRQAMDINVAGDLQRSKNGTGQTAFIVVSRDASNNERRFLVVAEDASKAREAVSGIKDSSESGAGVFFDTQNETAVGRGREGIRQQANRAELVGKVFQQLSSLPDKIKPLEIQVFSQPRQDKYIEAEKSARENAHAVVVDVEVEGHGKRPAVLTFNSRVELAAFVAEAAREGDSRNENLQGITLNETITNRLNSVLVDGAQGDAAQGTTNSGSSGQQLTDTEATRLLDFQGKDPEAGMDVLKDEVREHNNSHDGTENDVVLVRFSKSGLATQIGTIKLAAFTNPHSDAARALLHYQNEGYSIERIYPPAQSQETNTDSSASTGISSEQEALEALGYQTANTGRGLNELKSDVEAHNSNHDGDANDQALVRVARNGQTAQYATIKLEAFTKPESNAAQALEILEDNGYAFQLIYPKNDAENSPSTASSSENTGDRLSRDQKIEKIEAAHKVLKWEVKDVSGVRIQELLSEIEVSNSRSTGTENDKVLVKLDARVGDDFYILVDRQKFENPNNEERDAWKNLQDVGFKVQLLGPR